MEVVAAVFLSGGEKKPGPDMGAPVPEGTAGGKTDVKRCSAPPIAYAGSGSGVQEGELVTVDLPP